MYNADFLPPPKKDEPIEIKIAPRVSTYVVKEAYEIICRRIRKQCWQDLMKLNSRNSSGYIDEAIFISAYDKETLARKWGIKSATR